MPIASHSERKKKRKDYTPWGVCSGRGCILFCSASLHGTGFDFGLELWLMYCVHGRRLRRACGRRLGGFPLHRQASFTQKGAQVNAACGCFPHFVSPKAVQPFLCTLLCTLLHGGVCAPVRVHANAWVQSCRCEPSQLGRLNRLCVRDLFESYYSELF